MSSRSVRDPVSENKNGRFLRDDTRASPLTYVLMLVCVSTHPCTHTHATARTWTHTNIYAYTYLYIYIRKFTDIITFAFKTLDCTYKQIPFKSYEWKCIVCIYEILKQNFFKIKITNEIYKFLVLGELLITHVRQGGPADRGTCHQAWWPECNSQEERTNSYKMSSDLCMGTHTSTHTQ